MTKEEEFDLDKLHPSVRWMQETIGNAQAAFAAFQASCKHHIVRFGGAARCQICGQDFGWWCPNAPDHFCAYLQGEEQCRYCGEPNERK